MPEGSVNTKETDGCALQTETNSTGWYAFDNLQAGVYEATAFATGYVTRDYNCAPGPGGACGDRDLRIDASSHLKINLSLLPESTIHGTVTTPDGQPVSAGLHVTAIPKIYLKLTPSGTYSNWGEAVTDKNGNFSLHGLAPSDYFIRVYQEIGGRVVLPGPWYHEVWYGDTPSPTDATVVHLGTGQHLDNLHITTHQEGRHQVFLWPSGPAGLPSPREYIITIRDANITALKQTDGSYLIPNVPPGHYRLNVVAAGLPVTESWPYYIDLDVPDHDLTLHSIITMDKSQSDRPR
jgi:hypothetical protein